MFTAVVWEKHAYGYQNMCGQGEKGESGILKSIEEVFGAREVVWKKRWGKKGRKILISGVWKAALQNMNVSAEVEKSLQDSIMLPILMWNMDIAWGAKVKSDCIWCDRERQMEQWESGKAVKSGSGQREHMTNREWKVDYESVEYT